MICAECGRCGRRSMLSQRTTAAPAHASAAAAALPGPGEGPAQLRCDLCGSRRVRVVRFDSPFAAVAFVTGRQSGG